MRKFIATILALLYLVVSTGASLYTHYCMDKLVEIGLMTNTYGGKCSNCGMEKALSKKSGCCKDQHTLVKLDKDQKANDVSFEFLKVFAHATPVSYFEIPAINFSSITEENPTGNAPPQNGGIAIYKRNCVFRI